MAANAHPRRRLLTPAVVTRLRRAADRGDVLFRRGRGWFSLDDAQAIREGNLALEESVRRGEDPIPWDEAWRILLRPRGSD